MSKFKIKSSAFKDGERIPRKYTCDGENISPPLTWKDVPSGTVTLAIISDDPDAPSKTWTHWLIFNIPPEINSLPEGVETVGEFENGIIQGLNDFGNLGYGGPCPPFGVHRYFFKLYALDKRLELEPGASKEELLEAMKGHIIEKTEIIGLYSRD
ncbi:MAG TPA: YbhB/YbcL family Raf kinase inhibitor-like protein [Methanothermobacter sp.]|nr:phospholipid-binding protein, PBP family [Methanothermobacter sp. MT-2]HHW05172.1 YbhB/YbcL family Raf kinase inhibitor-like protein [Methanothermobacter sp.]HOK73316.1 YbhB/YbcL family Raf kinase inhibitor-like protein [Methanothermobacter sp.]HOL69731.1 YbhB/YbcL family Raf kinase inhibitor-like protein [Methanothermobacter sp.]HPQ05173.1 YbhB/YbcL family Raf kinase inhibitor-like protein [Methanothermobacter sp.]